jgi:hypothetical protein
MSSPPIHNPIAASIQPQNFHIVFSPGHTKKNPPDRIVWRVEVR